jgi:hypothetical protein
MNLSLKAMAVVATLLTSLSAQASTTALAEKYLRATQIPEMLQAQVEGYADQYAKGQDVADRKRVHDYLERVMGWEALKEHCLSLVQSTCTEREINALLQFVNTPAGRATKAKNTPFAAQRAQEVAAERRAADGQDAREDQDIAPADLVLARVEKYQAALDMARFEPHA